MVTQEQGWIASRNSTGHAAKVRKGQRVKAANAVRVGGRRVASVMGAESQIDTNLVGQEVLSWAGKHLSPDTPQPYWTPREGAGGHLSLEEELDASSVFDPLQSSQGAEGP